MKIKLTGLSAEFLKENVLDIERVKSVSDVRKELINKYPELENFDMKIAVNSLLSDEKTSISNDDDVLVFGAYAGG